MGLWSQETKKMKKQSEKATVLTRNQVLSSSSGLIYNLGLELSKRNTKRVFLFRLVGAPRGCLFTFLHGMIGYPAMAMFLLEGAFVF